MTLSIITAFVYIPIHIVQKVLSHHILVMLYVTVVNMVPHLGFNMQFYDN